MAQGDQGIDLHRAPRWDIAGQRPDSKEHNRHQGQRDRIVRGHVEKQVCDKARRNHSARYANRNANYRERQRLAQDHAKNRAGLRAKGQSNPHFMRPARNRVRDHSENPHGCEDQSDPAKQTEESSAKAGLCHRCTQDIGERHDIGYR